jgi:hypothetical protein
MNTSEVLSSEKQQNFRNSVIFASTVVDRVKVQQHTYSVTCHEIVNCYGILNFK